MRRGQPPSLVPCLSRVPKSSNTVPWWLENVCVRAFAVILQAEAVPPRDLVRVFGILGVIGLVVVNKKVCWSLIKYPILPVYEEVKAEAVLVLRGGGWKPSSLRCTGVLSC